MKPREHPWHPARVHALEYPREIAVRVHVNARGANDSHALRRGIQRRADLLHRHAAGQQHGYARGLIRRRPAHERDAVELELIADAQHPAQRGPPAHLAGEDGVHVAFVQWVHGLARKRWPRAQAGAVVQPGVAGSPLMMVSRFQGFLAVRC